MTKVWKKNVKKNAAKEKNTHVLKSMIKCNTLENSDNNLWFLNIRIFKIANIPTLTIFTKHYVPRNLQLFIQKIKI